MVYYVLFIGFIVHYSITQYKNTRGLTLYAFLSEEIMGLVAIIEGENAFFVCFSSHEIFVKFDVRVEMKSRR